MHAQTQAHTHRNTQGHPRTHKCTHRHTHKHKTHTCLVYTLPIMGDMPYQRKEQKATIPPVHIWYTGYGHGVAA